MHRPDPDDDARPERDVAPAVRAAADEDGLPADFAAEAGIEPLGGSLADSNSLTEADDVPRPIGPERLRALREAIRRGIYPADADVLGGLVTLFGRGEDAPAAEPPSEDEED